MTRPLFTTLSVFLSCPCLVQALMVGRDALLIAGSIAYRFKTRREGDDFFDLDSLDYKVTPSTLSKVRATAAAAVCFAETLPLLVPTWLLLLLLLLPRPVVDVAAAAGHRCSQCGCTDVQTLNIDFLCWKRAC